MAGTDGKGRQSEEFNNRIGEDDDSASIIDVENMPDLSGSAFGFVSLDSYQEKNSMDFFNNHANIQDVQIPQCVTPESPRPPSTEQPRGFDEVPLEKLSLAKTVHSLGNMLAGAWAGDDADVSLHEIHIGDNELEQFDAEFSDLDDSNQGDDTNNMDYPPAGESIEVSKNLGLDDIPMPLPEEAVSFRSPDNDKSDMESEDVVDMSSLSKKAQENESAAVTPDTSNSTQTRLASMYLHSQDVRSEQSPFDDTLFREPPRRSNIFGDTKLSLDLESESQRSDNQDANHMKLSGSTSDHNADPLIGEVSSQEKQKVMTCGSMSDDDAVTDLAYVSSFPEISDSAFVTAKDLSNVDDNEFVSGGDIKDRLDEDEKEFEKENVFIQDATAMSVQSGMQDSWSVHSSIFSHQATPDLSTSYMRISIGQFIESRTEVLGALDGQTDIRPHFGTHIVTPPSNRAPVPLLYKNCHDSTEVSEQQVRESGVGSDVDQMGFDHGDGAADVSSNPPPTDRTLTTDDLTGPVATENHASPSLRLAPSDPDSAMKRDRSCSPEGGSSECSQGRASTQLETDKNTPTDSMQCDIKEALNGDRGLDRQASGKDKDENANSKDVSHDDVGRTRSCDESSMFMSLSTINDVLQSDNKKPEDIVSYVMHVTQAKVKSKVRQNSRERRKAAVEARLASSDSSDVDVGDKTRDGVNKARNTYSQGRPAEPVRRPADGRSALLPKAKQAQIPAKGFSSGAPSSDAHSPSLSSDNGRQTEQRRADIIESRLRVSNEAERTRVSAGGSSCHDVIRDQSSSTHLTNGTVRTERVGLADRKPSSAEASSPSSVTGVNSQKAEKKSRLSCSKTVTCSLGERSNSLSSLQEHRKGSESTVIGKYPSMHELGSSIKSSTHGKSSPRPNLQYSAECDPVYKENKTSQKTVTRSRIGENVLRPRENIPVNDKHRQQSSNKKSLDDDEFEEKFASYFTQSQNQDEKWKSPRLSSVCRSQAELTSAKNGNKLVQSKNQEIPKVKVTTSRKVQFQKEADTEAPGSDPGLSSDSDFKSSGTGMKSSAELKGRWLSSTPKLPLSEDEICQAGLSHIVASPRDSFLQNCTEPTLWSSQDKTREDLPNTHGVLRFISKPDEGVLLRPAEKELCGDDFIQNSGSYRPARDAESAQGRALPKTTTMVGQDPENNPESTKAQSKPVGKPQTQYSGVFKVPEPPQQAVLHDEHQPLISSVEQAKDLLFQTSLSPQHLMTNTLSMSRLHNDHESILGLPANQSTPFGNTSQDMLESRKQEFSDTLRRPDRKSAHVSNNSAHSTVTDTWGNHKQVISLVVPKEARIPGVCCVGLSLQGNIPVENSSEHWLQLKISVKSLSIDGQAQNPVNVMPFIYKEMVMVGPHSSQDIRVVFAPGQSGTYVAQLEVTINLMSRQPSIAQMTKLVTVIAVAEKPLIQIYTGSHRDLLDFGSLPWGREKGLPLVLINRTRANIHVRLVISAIHATVSSFSFGKPMSSNISAVSNQLRPDIPSLKRTIVNVLLPGADDDDNVEPVEIVVYFRSPERQADRVLLSMPPEQFHASLGVELDTPYSMISLGSVRLRAAAGVARLHAPAECELIRLKTTGGKPTMQRIPLKNAGNIPLDVSLEVTHWPDVFTVVPMQLMIEPGGTSEFLLKFDPKQTHLTEFDSLLLMSVEPDGPAYEVPVHGETITQSIVNHTPQYIKQPVHLLSNKKYLAWPGLPIGSQSTQTLILRNAGNDHMKILLEIRDESGQFQIISSYGHKKKLTKSKEVMLKPLEEYPVHVCFKPTKRGGAFGKLVVRLCNSTFKYALPLSGYSGVSELTLEGVRSSSLNSCWVSLGHPVVGNVLFAAVTVCNRGTQAAYVKAIGFEDMNCKRKVRSAVKLNIQPSEFCLNEHSSQEVMIQLTPTEKEASLCLERDAIIMTIGFFYGSEISRQLYREALKMMPDKPVCLSDSSPLRDVNFDMKFDGEDLIVRDRTIRSTRSDIELFYSSMKQLTLALVGSKVSEKPLTNSQPATRQYYYTTANDRVTSEPEVKPVQRERTRVSLPVRDQCSTNGSVDPQSCDNKALSSTDDSWTLEPRKIILTVGEEGDVHPFKKLQITNFTDAELNFYLMWPGHFVTVTPGQGTVLAKSFTSVCLSAKPQLLLQKTQLPWSGEVVVTCNGQTKDVSVQIHVVDDVSETRRPTAVAAVCPQTSRQPITPLIAVATPNSKNSTSSHLRVTQQKLEFHDVKVLHTAEQSVEIRNICSHPIRWNITSFIPPYFKPAVGDGEVFRVTYSVFRLPKIMGILDPHESVQISVSFLPRERGRYSQYWEIRSEVMDCGDYEDGPSHTCKLELQGKCVQADEDDKPREEKTEAKVVPSQRQSTRKIMCKSRELTLSTDSLHFTVTRRGAQEEQKIKIGNKAKEVIQVTVISPPRDPFHIKTTAFQVKPRHYLHYPIVFRPQKEGFYKALLSLQKPSGEILTVKLSGSCTDH